MDTGDRVGVVKPPGGRSEITLSSRYDLVVSCRRGEVLTSLSPTVLGLGAGWTDHRADGAPRELPCVIIGRALMWCGGHGVAIVRGLASSIVATVARQHAVHAPDTPHVFGHSLDCEGADPRGVFEVLL